MDQKQEYYYMLLSRLQMDCESFLDKELPCKKLWGITIKDHISKMFELYRNMHIKPNWISIQDIVFYKLEMNKINNK